MNPLMRRLLAMVTEMNPTMRGVLTALAGVVVILFALWPSQPPSPGPGPGGSAEGSYLFCFWNVENLFDDRDDGRTTRGDDKPDRWFASDPDALRQKLKNLADVLLSLNDGKGPDILAMAELESERAAELVQETLNARLSDPSLHYTHVLFEQPSGGRHIANAVLTRLAVDAGKTQVLGKRLRILEGQIKAADRPLAVIASHWSSRISDKDGHTRAKYGDQIYGRFKAMFIANPKVDLLVCGDFNDSPDDDSVTKHLQASGDEQAVRDSGGKNPLLFNLMAELWRKGEGSLCYRGQPFLFDQICVSPGMLDQEGWSAEVASATIVRQMADAKGRPIRFGTASEKRPLSARGASDHFPVTVRLRVW